jgi:pimeloyl-ACP methyl ester carboxylesterase
MAFAVSVGGPIAQRFALDHPERIAGLVLCSGAAAGVPTPTRNGPPPDAGILTHRPSGR